jgi:hypothetical protein
MAQGLPTDGIVYYLALASIDRGHIDEARRLLQEPGTNPAAAELLDALQP